jgi:hypothetical protein
MQELGVSTLVSVRFGGVENADPSREAPELVAAE